LEEEQGKSFGQIEKRGRKEKKQERAQEINWGGRGEQQEKGEKRREKVHRYEKEWGEEKDKENERKGDKERCWGKSSSGQRVSRKLKNGKR